MAVKTKKSPKEAGTEYLESLLAHVPAESRDQLRATLAGNEALITELGAGYKRQDETSKLFDEARELQRKAEAEQAAAMALHDRNKKWYEENLPTLAVVGELGGREALERVISVGGKSALQKMLEATGGESGSGEGGEGGEGGRRVAQPAIDPKQFVRAQDLPNLVSQMVGPTATNLQILTVQGPALALRHMQEFKDENGQPEVLDISELIQFAQHGKYDSITKAYNDFVAPRRQEAQAERHKAEIEAAKKQARDEAIAEMRKAGMPYPIASGRPEDVGPLEAALAAGNNRENFTVDAAAAAYLAGTAR